MNGPSGLPGPPVTKIVPATDSTVKANREEPENVWGTQTCRHVGMPTHPAVLLLKRLWRKKFATAKTAVKPLGNLPVIMGSVSILTGYVMATITVGPTRMSTMMPVQES